jgi:hypothetical protein
LTPPYYKFTDENGTEESPPTLKKGKTYIFNREGISKGPALPFNLGDKWRSNTTGIPAISTGKLDETAVNNINSIDKFSSIIITIPPDYSGILKYYSHTDETMIGKFAIVE